MVKTHGIVGRKVTICVSRGNSFWVFIEVSSNFTGGRKKKRRKDGLTDGQSAKEEKRSVWKENENVMFYL